MPPAKPVPAKPAAKGAPPKPAPVHIPDPEPEAVPTSPLPQLAAPAGAEPKVESNFYGPRNFSRDEMDVIKNTVAQGLTDFEFKLFMHYCQVGGFDPMRKQAYASIQKAKCQTCYAKPENWTTPNHVWGPGACKGNCDKGFIRQIAFIAGIDGLMARALRHPDFLGITHGVVHQNDEFMFDAVQGLPLVHTFGVKDRGPVAGAWAVVKLRGKDPMAIWYLATEYAKSGGFVAGNAPELMLDKSVMSICLRRALPDPFSGAYVAEEFGKTAVLQEDGTVILQHGQPADSDPVEPVATRALEAGFAESIEMPTQREPEMVPAKTAVVEAVRTAAPAPAAVVDPDDFDARVPDPLAARRQTPADVAQGLAAVGIGNPLAITASNEPSEEVEMPTGAVEESAPPPASESVLAAQAQAAAAAEPVADPAIAEREAIIAGFKQRVIDQGWDFSAARAALREASFNAADQYKLTTSNMAEAERILHTIADEKRKSLYGVAAQLGWRVPQTPEEREARKPYEPKIDSIKIVLGKGGFTTWPLLIAEIPAAEKFLREESARQTALRQAEKARQAAASAGAPAHA